jgi:multidrug resistance efflux pump
MSVVRGQAVTAGQAIATVADLSNLWIVAYVDETSFKDVRPGQPAEIYVNALNRYLPGRVAGLLPDLPPPPATGQRASGPNTARPIAQVPVRLAFDPEDAVILPGMTTTIKIFIR